MSEQTPSKRPASNGFVGEAAAWAALVRWREDLAAPLHARIAELERERDAAQARVAELEAKSHTYCAYCGHKEEIDPNGTAIAQHIAQCKKHPMRRVERERDTAREIVEKMEAERYVTLQRLDELVRERNTAYEAIAETRQFLARVSRAYRQWMDACAPREWCSLKADDKEQNGIIKHMHDMMALLVTFSEECPPYNRAVLGKEADRG